MKLFLFNTVLVLAFIVLSHKCIAQQLQLKGGFGNFEGFNVGISHTKKQFFVEYGIGSDFNLYGQGYCNTIHLGAGRRILKNAFSASEPVYATVKGFIWNLNNQSNVFSAFSLSAECNYRINISQEFQLGLFVGLVWTSVFNYKRKGYQEIGFPKDWQPNAGITLYKKIK